MANETIKAGRVDRCNYGTNEIGTPYASNDGGYFRLDVYHPLKWGEPGTTERRFAAGPDDYSPMLVTGVNREWSSDCSCCFLGFSHTVDAHDARANAGLGDDKRVSRR